MPLRAHFNGDDIVSVNYSDAQWSELKNLVSKGSSLTLPCCGKRAGLRTNRDGIKYFVHAEKNEACNAKPEKAEQLKARSEIVSVLQANGWQVTPEFIQSECYFDVLATKDNKKIGFVLEWTKLSIEDLSQRYPRYDEVGIRTCWFLLKLQRRIRDHVSAVLASKQNPAFLIQLLDDHNVEVLLGRHVFSLPDFTGKLLNGKFKFCQSLKLAPVQEVEIVIFPMSCWKCKRDQHSYTVSQNLTSLCGEEMYLDGGLGSGDALDKHPAIVRSVFDFVQSGQGTEIRIGEVKPRFSRTMGHPYLSHGCYYCDALFGDFFQITDKLDGLNDPGKIVIRRTVSLGTIRQEGDHWCYSESSQFCE